MIRHNFAQRHARYNRTALLRAAWRDAQGSGSLSSALVASRICDKPLC